MAHGLEVYDALGNTRLSVTDRITRLLYTRFLPYTESSSVVVPGFDSANGAAFSIMLNGYHGHNITSSGETVYWTADGDYQGDSQLIVILYK